MQSFAFAPVKTTVIYKYTGFDVVFSSPTKGVPTVDSTMLGTFWTNDVFSAENPFTEEVTMATNVTNLLTFYCCLVLFDEGADPAYLPLHAADNNSNNEEYAAPIQSIQFNLSGPVHYALVQAPLFFGNYSSYPQNAEAPLTLGDASELFNIQFQRTTTQLTWIVIAFGIFLLQPIAEAILGTNDKTEPIHQNHSPTIVRILRWRLQRFWWKVEERMRRELPPRE